MKIHATLIITAPGKPPDQIQISGKSSTLGSASTNTICLKGILGVAALHARFDMESKGFSITAYSNSQITKVNNLNLVAGRSQQLFNGDVITIGRANIKFLYQQDKSPLVNLKNTNRTKYSQATGFFTKNRLLVILGGIAGLSVFLWLSIATFSSTKNDCNNQIAVEAKPDSDSVKIEIMVANSNCIKSVKYILADTVQIAERTSFPYDIVIDSNAPHFSSIRGQKQKLTIVVEDRDGNQATQDTLIELPEKKTENVQTETSQNIEDLDNGKLSQMKPDVVTTSTGFDPLITSKINILAVFLSNEYDYNLEDPQFQRLLIENIKIYKSKYGNFWKRGSTHKDNIRTAFSAYKIKPAIGYILAFSRSEFDPEKDSEGIWKIPVATAKENGFIQNAAELTDDETAAKVAADYTKSIRDTFENNLLLTVAHFGETTGAAGKLNARASQSLSSSERKNISKLRNAQLINDEQLQRLARFFAVAIIASYPKEMGLDVPSLSEIYG